jgi:hypothetical protein
MARARHPKRKYTDFAAAIDQAKAQARVKAEKAVLEDSPTAWLRSGPGRETSLELGWTNPVQPKITETNQQINLLLSPQFQSLFAAILQVLAPFPDARVAVAQALAGPTTTTPP